MAVKPKKPALTKKVAPVQRSASRSLKPQKHKELTLYHVHWNTHDPAIVEAYIYHHGGYVTVNGVKIGKGPVYHFNQLIKLLMPWFQFNKWNQIIVDAWPLYDTIAVLGPASSGKTYAAAACAYAEFFAHPQGTSILCSSITLQGLRLRVWGALVDIISRVQQIRPDAPGYIVDSDLRIFPSQPSASELKNPKDAIIGLACKIGDEWVGISSFVGLHNERVFGIFDEASLMPRSFWDATANLRKSPKTKFVAIGNPKDPNDALGVIAEPHRDIGGWEAAPTPNQTCTWKAIGTNAITIQLYGLDGPNFGPEGVKFPYLITPSQVQEDKLRYGEDSWQFQMMDLGVMPKGVGSRRVITRQLCERGNAFAEPVWHPDSQFQHFIGLDPSFSPEDGDRTALVKITTGIDVHHNPIVAVSDGPIIIQVSASKTDANGKPLTTEDQIAMFVKDYAAQHAIPPSHMGFDSTGHGALAVALAKHWSPLIHAVEFGGKAPDRKATTGQDKTERDLYGKMVSALWFAARNAIAAGQVRNLPTAVFEEGAMREFLITKDGKEDVEPKLATRRRLGKSPDLFDAFAIAIEVARRNGFQIAGPAGQPKPILKVNWLEQVRKKFIQTIRNYSLQ